MRQIKKPFLRVGALFICFGLLFACSGESGETELKKFISETKSRRAGDIEPIPAVRIYQPYFYPKVGLRDPFTPIIAEKDPQNRPDMARLRQVLEGFPLDALHVVGIIQEPRDIWALIAGPDGIVHKVHTGDYMGTHFGRIIQIHSEGIVLNETIPGDIGWAQRKTELKLIKGEG